MTTMFATQRDTNIDLLRLVGLSLIILAHVSPPLVLWDLRCFDVPLMVFVSGLAYSGRNPNFSLSFFLHRILRLVLPVWIFLTLYFTSTYFMKQVFGVDFGIQESHVVGSYLLMDGIGYVWIIRVFLMIALITPFVLYIDKKCIKQRSWLIVLASVLLGSNLLYYNGIFVNRPLMLYFVYFLLGYLPFFMIGVRMKQMSCRLQWSITIAALLLLTFSFGLMGGVLNDSKYPPRGIFQLYGIMMSILSFKAFRHCNLSRVPSWLLFVSQNTIWIYLYHIPLVQLTGMLHMSWYIRYIIVYLFAIMIVTLQVYIVRKLKSRKNLPIYKYLVG